MVIAPAGVGIGIDIGIGIGIDIDNGNDVIGAVICSSVCACALVRK